MLAACGDEPSAPPPPPSSGPTCPPARIELPSEPGYATSAAIERRLSEMVTRDVDSSACVVRVVGRHESLLVEVSHAGETIRARLAAPSGVPTETLAAHVAAHRLLRALLDAHVENAVVNGRGVALGLGDHAAICYRSAGGDPQCVRTEAVLAFESITEPSVRRLVTRALTSPTAAVEWELVLGDDATFATRRGSLLPGRALGAPPPDVDRFTRVRTASSEASTPTPDHAAETIASAMPLGAATVRLETRSVRSTQLVMLSRCEGLLAHCSTLVATREGTTLRFAPSFTTDPARLDAVEDASTFAAGALAVRIVEAGHHEDSASELFVTPWAGALGLESIALGHETEHGEGDTITEGCYRTLTIEGPARVRLSDPHGWSGSHSGARGWNVVASRTCTAEATLCLAANGFEPCS